MIQDQMRQSLLAHAQEAHDHAEEVRATKKRLLAQAEEHEKSAKHWDEMAAEYAKLAATYENDIVLVEVAGTLPESDIVKVVK